MSRISSVIPSAARNPVRQGMSRSARHDTSSGKGDAVLRFLDDEVDDVAEVVPFLVRGELAVRAGAAAHDLACVVDLLARAEAVDHVVDELEQLRSEEHTSEL